MFEISTKKLVQEDGGDSGLYCGCIYWKVKGSIPELKLMRESAYVFDTELEAKQSAARFLMDAASIASVAAFS